MNPQIKDLLSRFTSRSTLFCSAFTLGTFVALFAGKLTSADFPMTCAVILSAVVGHSVSCSYFEQKQKPDQDKGVDDPDAK